MKNYDFWKKTSNYSIVVCGIVLIAKMFFKQYLKNVIVHILFIGGLALLLCLFSEIMKYLTKNKR